MKYFIIVATVTSLLVGLAAAINDRYRICRGYVKNHDGGQSDDCGNGYLPMNVACQNTASQIQGEVTIVDTASTQSFPWCRNTDK